MKHVARVIALFIVLYMYDKFSREEGQIKKTMASIGRAVMS